jgi:hypothetical protein
MSINILFFLIKINKNLIFMDPYIVDYSVEIPTRCSVVIELIIPKFFKGLTFFERHTVHHQEPLPRLSGHSNAHSALTTAGHHMGI